MSDPVPVGQLFQQSNHRHIVIRLGVTALLILQPIFAISQCNLVITDPPAVCSPNTVDITDPAVTAGSSSGMTFTYWTDKEATKPVTNPTSVRWNRTVYIKGVNEEAGCSMVAPVKIIINRIPVLTIHDPYSACKGQSVDLTSPAITQGSEMGLTITYWLDSKASEPLANPERIQQTGTYYLKAVSIHGCSVVSAVHAKIMEEEGLILIAPPNIEVGCYLDIPLPETNQVYCCSTCDGNIEVTHVGDVSEGNTCDRKITRTYQAKDVCGQVATCEQTIWVRTLQFSIPDRTVECIEEVLTPELSDFYINGNCTLPTLTIISREETNDCPRVVLFHFRLTDECGNVVESSQTVTVMDITPPIFVDIPTDIIVDCNSIPDPPMPMAIEECLTSIVIVSYIEASNTVVDCQGTIERVWTVTDLCGNISTASQIITVIPATGIENLTDQPSFRIYPNPNNGKFTFEYQSAKNGPVRVSVVDMTGRVVWDRNFPNGSAMREEIRMPDNVRGMFFVRVMSHSSEHFQEIVIE
jgi:hypothetical protein